MSFQCLRPYVAYKQFNLSNGDKVLKFLSQDRVDYNLADLKKKHGSENVFLIPCGTCENCRRNKAEEWAVRCQLESHYHNYNYFVTLTFDQAHYQYACTDDMKKFLDRLEGKNHYRRFKYFCSQEYGELNQRLHFHLVLFCDFPIDLDSPVKIGDFYHYHSNMMDKLWDLGFYTISPFETTCARYVAKYTAKDSKLFMSRNLGKLYFLEHLEEIVDDDFKVYADFGGKYVSYVPSCFLRWYEELDPLIVDNHKRFIKDLAHLVQAEKLRARVVSHEEDVIYGDIDRSKEKGNNKRVL